MSSERKPSQIRRDRIEQTRRNSQASALRQLRAAIRKVRRASARHEETITLWMSEAETLVHFCTIKTSRPGAPKVTAEFLRWMARDVCLRRDGGAKAKVANSEVSEAWQVSGAMVEKVVREYGADAQDWLKQHGADRDSTAALIADWAALYRMVGGAERQRHSAARAPGLGHGSNGREGAQGGGSRPRRPRRAF